MNTERVIYDSNINDLIDDEVKAFRNDPVDYMRNDFRLDADDMYESIVRFMRTHTFMNRDNYARAKKLVHDMDEFNSMDYDENADRFDSLLALVSEDETGLGYLASYVENALYESPEFQEDRVEEEREYATYLLSEMGFLKEGKAEKWIILSYNGIKQTYDFQSVADVKDVLDMEKAVTGDYDYNITIKREDGNPYLDVIVSSHDAPTGVLYAFVPVSKLEEVMKDTDLATALHETEETWKEELEGE